ncbi:diguanylate cyclase domain-containing protein [Thiocystis violascens]|uniref:diguanylate cyclase domain-containing protein n=1 Tax=Thiocystis violascens TaxID=73141 RepID=UPI000694863F|nr:diguanylate cyclase [Thiocystis violascens]
MSVLLATGALVLSPPPACARDAVTLQLKWTHCFQFAGYYAAQEQGYYREAGLDVRLEEGLPGIDVVGRVVSGQADYGIGTSSLLLARAAGKPVVALAVILQHSPLVLIARQRQAAQSIHDLAGKRVMVEPDADEILAYLKREGIPPERLIQIDHSFEIQDLIDGRVDALTAYLSNEPELLDRLHVPYQMYTPRSAGIDFYADNLFTSERELHAHPERVRAFRAASLRGWEYALTHPDEIIELILTKYAGRDTREHYVFEAAQLRPLIRADLIEIGYMNPGRWAHMAETYAEIGLLPANVSLDGFLYDPSPAVDLSGLYLILAAVLGFTGIVGGVTVYIYRVNRRLRHSLSDLQQANGRLAVLSTAIENSPTSVVITGPDTLIQYVNPAFVTVTGYSVAEAVGQTPRILRSGLTEPTTFREMWSHLKRGEPWSGELINRRKSGEVYWEEAHVAPIKDRAGQTTHYVAVKLDITERKQAHQQLDYLAHHDALTHLPNRLLFFERVAQTLALAKRNQTKFALLFIDLDKFKPINDTHGHAVGDLVLRETAKRLSGCVRESDTVGRIGGDEFVVLLPHVGGAEHATIVANKIRQALRQPLTVAETTLFISSSIGIAIYPEHGHDQLALTAHADGAIYAAKASGRDRIQVAAVGNPASTPLNHPSAESAIEPPYPDR